MIEKKSNPSKKRQPASKRYGSEQVISKWMEDYLDCFTFKMQPVTEAFIERIAADLVHWAKTNPEAIKLSQFYAEKYILDETFRSWCNKYPTLKAARSIAKTFLGNRRESGGLTRKYDPGMVTLSMPNYDTEWKDLAEWKADIASKTHEGASGNAVYNITIPSFGSSGIVPDKKIKSSVDKKD